MQTVIAVAVLLAANPLLYRLYESASGMLPDSAAYIAFGHGLVSEGRFVLEGWGHADIGLVLPPLYPLLVELAARLTGDRLLAALGVSTGASVLASLALYMLVSRLADRRIALAAAAVAQVNYYYAWFGTGALTEPLFLFLLLVGFILAVVSIRDPSRAGPALALGLVSALAFLSRQIGILFPVVAGALLLAAAASRARQGETSAIRGLAAFGAGFLALFLPYSIALHAQTGQGPLTPQYRLGHYVVEAPAGAMLRPPPADYESEYARRRLGRVLTPDGSEMQDYLVAAPSANPAPQGPDSRALRAWFSIGATVSAWRKSLGPVLGILLVIAMISAAWPSRDRTERLPRLLVPSFIATYVGALAVLGSTVERYVFLLVPLAIAVIAVEARVRLADRWPRFASAGVAPPLFVAALALVMLVGQPLFLAAQWRGRVGLERSLFHRECHAAVPEGAVLFALHAGDALMVGGGYRVLPNDSIERVAGYARRTGVHGLVVTRSPNTASELRYYGNAEWLSALLLEGQAPPQLAVACVTSDGRGMVFRFMDP